MSISRQSIASRVSDHRAPPKAAIGPAHVLRYASPARSPQPAAPCDRLPFCPRDHLASRYFNGWANRWGCGSGSNLWGRLLLGLLAILLLLPASGARADAGPEEQFQRLHGYYQRLVETGEGRERGNWMRAARALEELHQRHPRHQVGPKSLYLLGNLYHQLYRRGGTSSDLAEAVAAMEKMQATYPRHPMADHALFYAANIFIHDLEDRQQARRTLARIIELYPDGGMAPGARKWLAQLRESTGDSSPSGLEADGMEDAGSQSEDRDELATILPVRHWSSDSYTRVVIETGKPVTYRSRLRDDDDNTQRLYLDLDGARLSPQIDSEIRQVKDGLLSRVRHIQPDAGKVRVILDTQTRIDDYEIFDLDNPYRVVIDLKGQPAPSRADLSAPAPIMTRSTTGPGLSLAQQLGMGVRRIVIDPGHGGRDPGAISPSGIKEKDVTLMVSRLLAEELRRRLGCEVILTRDRDVYMALEERTAIANSKDADLFISVHANSAANRQARGVETYILDMVASDDRAMRVAARENASSARSFGDLQGIVQKLLSNSRQQESQRLAEFVHKSTISGLRRVYGGEVSDRGVRRAPFVVLIGARMPAVLVEVGFLSHPDEEGRLSDEEYQAQLSREIASGVWEYARNLGFNR